MSDHREEPKGGPERHLSQEDLRGSPLADTTKNQGGAGDVQTGSNPPQPQGATCLNPSQSPQGAAAKLGNPNVPPTVTQNVTAARRIASTGRGRLLRGTGAFSSSGQPNRNPRQPTQGGNSGSVPPGRTTQNVAATNLISNTGCETKSSESLVSTGAIKRTTTTKPPQAAPPNLSLVTPDGNDQDTRTTDLTPKKGRISEGPESFFSVGSISRNPEQQQLGASVKFSSMISGNNNQKMSASELLDNAGRLLLSPEPFIPSGILNRNTTQTSQGASGKFSMMAPSNSQKVASSDLFDNAGRLLRSPEPFIPSSTTSRAQPPQGAPTNFGLMGPGNNQKVGGSDLFDKAGRLLRSPEPFVPARTMTRNTTQPPQGTFGTFSSMASGNNQNVGGSDLFTNTGRSTRSPDTFIPSAPMNRNPNTQPPQGVFGNFSMSQSLPSGDLLASASRMLRAAEPLMSLGTKNRNPQPPQETGGNSALLPPFNHEQLFGGMAPPPNMYMYGPPVPTGPWPCHGYPPMYPGPYPPFPRFCAPMHPSQEIPGNGTGHMPFCPAAMHGPHMFPCYNPILHMQQQQEIAGNNGGHMPLCPAALCGAPMLPYFNSMCPIQMPPEMHVNMPPNMFPPNFGPPMLQCFNPFGVNPNSPRSGGGDIDRAPGPPRRVAPPPRPAHAVIEDDFTREIRQSNLGRLQELGILGDRDASGNAQNTPIFSPYVCPPNTNTPTRFPPLIETARRNPPRTEPSIVYPPCTDPLCVEPPYNFPMQFRSPSPEP